MKDLMHPPGALSTSCQTSLYFPASVPHSIFLLVYFGPRTPNLCFSPVCKLLLSVHPLHCENTCIARYVHALESSVWFKTLLKVVYPSQNDHKHNPFKKESILYSTSFSFPHQGATLHTLYSNGSGFCATGSASSVEIVQHPISKS